MNKIEAVWGTCDGKGIFFTQVSNDTWACDVPPDLEDGTYYVEIYGRTQSGVIIYTTAILHMFDSKCVLFEMVDDGVYIAIRSNDIDVKIVKDEIEVCIAAYSVELLKDMFKVVMVCD